MNNKWKTAFWIIFILFILENLLIVWGYSINAKQERQTLQCYYNTCEEYPEASLDGRVCSCYDYDLIGNLQIAKITLLD